MVITLTPGALGYIYIAVIYGNPNKSGLGGLGGGIEKSKI